VDTAFREGGFETDPLPIVPGSDYAGTVVDVGERVDAFGPGDRVFGTSIGGRRCGGYAEYASILQTTSRPSRPASVSRWVQAWGSPSDTHFELSMAALEGSR